MDKDTLYLSSLIFDKATVLINDGIRKGEHPLVCITAVNNILRKSKIFSDEFILVLISDLCNMYFWHPEHTLYIDKKWHTPNTDLYKPYQTY